MRTIFILLDLIISLALPTALADDPSVAFYKNYHIHIVSDLPDQPPELNVHCKSKDSDLGVKLLRASEVYTIVFKINFWRSTLFFCQGEWGKNRRSFDAFRTKRDAWRCEKHGRMWSIRPDGFYFSKDWENWHLEYKWSEDANSSSPS